MLSLNRKITPIFSLDSPYPHEIFEQQGKDIVCQGFLFALEQKIDKLCVQGGKYRWIWPLDQERAELKQFLPAIHHSHQSGFQGRLPVQPINWEFVAFWGQKKKQVANYDWAFLFAEEHWWRAISQELPSEVIPPPELISLTQGIGNPSAYRGSIFTGAWLLKRIWKKAFPQKFLDFGCGSGRLSLALWLLQKELFPVKIIGVDLNERLIEWAQTYLPPEISFFPGSLRPPLPFEDASFEAVMLISVFTHLSLETQRLWLEEFYRLLRPGGYLLLTLHGPLYAKALLSPSQQKKFWGKGYFELAGPEGSNDFTSFHRPGFVVRFLRPGFKCLRFFREGNLGQPFPFRLAFLQDVYLFQRV